MIQINLKFPFEEYTTSRLQALICYRRLLKTDKLRYHLIATANRRNINNVMTKTNSLTFMSIV